MKKFVPLLIVLISIILSCTNSVNQITGNRLDNNKFNIKADYYHYEDYGSIYNPVWFKTIERVKTEYYAVYSTDSGGYEYKLSEENVENINYTGVLFRYLGDNNWRVSFAHKDNDFKVENGYGYREFEDKYQADSYGTNYYAKSEVDREGSITVNNDKITINLTGTIKYYYLEISAGSIPNTGGSYLPIPVQYYRIKKVISTTKEIVENTKEFEIRVTPEIFINRLSDKKIKIEPKDKSKEWIANIKLINNYCDDNNIYSQSERGVGDKEIELPHYGEYEVIVNYVSEASVKFTKNIILDGICSTPSPTPTIIFPPSPTPTPTITITPIPSISPTISPTPSVSPSPSPTPTIVPTPTPSITPTPPQPTPTPTPTPNSCSIDTNQKIDEFANELLKLTNDYNFNSSFSIKAIKDPDIDFLVNQIIKIKTSSNKQQALIDFLNNKENTRILEKILKKKGLSKIFPAINGISTIYDCYEFISTVIDLINLLRNIDSINQNIKASIEILNSEDCKADKNDKNKLEKEIKDLEQEVEKQINTLNIPQLISKSQNILNKARNLCTCDSNNVYGKPASIIRQEAFDYIFRDNVYSHIFGKDPTKKHPDLPFVDHGFKAFFEKYPNITEQELVREILNKIDFCNLKEGVFKFNYPNGYFINAFGVTRIKISGANYTNKTLNINDMYIPEGEPIL